MGILFSVFFSCPIKLEACYNQPNKEALMEILLFSEIFGVVR